ncbi:MAG TPA: shikimate kinase [Phenylobacterium sp.]|jgi:shikimate kinase|uniref:shikimate kinase n=1 Tax=Phenylobacterium sp. TaxID=1871053 RepID=UPI002D0629F6|nr:shikimate kinase [Phenylobacterium sp.]HXA38051.1 shikimate kinase [Phenylobacterium sp.]
MDRYAPLRRRTIALVGLMGVGKSSVGRRLANALELPFRDTDSEVEAAAGCSISDIFADLGEEAFREGERRVIARLLEQEPHVLATGGGAFMNEQTRALIKSQAVSVWLKADLDVLARRVSRKDTRPLLAGRDPLEVLQAQAAVRYPVYGEADVTVETGDAAHHVTVDQVIRALGVHLEASEPKASLS